MPHDDLPPSPEETAARRAAETAASEAAAAAVRAEAQEDLVDGMFHDALKAAGKARGTKEHPELKRRADWLESQGAMHPDKRKAIRDRAAYEVDVVGRLDKALSEWTDHAHQRERVIGIVMPFIREALRK